MAHNKVETIHAQMWDRYSDKVVASDRDRDDVGSDLSDCITTTILATLELAAEMGDNHASWAGELLAQEYRALIKMANGEKVCQHGIPHGDMCIACEGWRRRKSEE